MGCMSGAVPFPLFSLVRDPLLRELLEPLLRGHPPAEPENAGKALIITSAFYYREDYLLALRFASGLRIPVLIVSPVPEKALARSSAQAPDLLTFLNAPADPAALESFLH